MKGSSGGGGGGRGKRGSGTSTPDPQDSEKKGGSSSPTDRAKKRVLHCPACVLSCVSPPSLSVCLCTLSLWTCAWNEYFCFDKTFKNVMFPFIFNLTLQVMQRVKTFFEILRKTNFVQDLTEDSLTNLQMAIDLEIIFLKVETNLIKTILNLSY